MTTDLESNPPSLLLYSKRILAAIDALDDKNGSNESAIAGYIESEYKDLPQGYSPLLSHYLNVMKESGELLMVNDNYMRPNPNAPPKRGRGRPPKPKLPLPSDTVVSPPNAVVSPPNAHVSPPNAVVSPSNTVVSPPNIVVSPPRGRGRPPKPKDPLAVASAKAAHGMPKRRGRPPKIVRSAGAVPAAVSSGGVKRGRGRPPKVKPQFTAVGII